MKFIFENQKLWSWQAATGQSGSWYFITLPKDDSTIIKEFHGKQIGFGSVKVKVTLGATSWETSLFPSKEHGAYLLPIKKLVRTKEKLDISSTIQLTVELTES